jgi:pectate lyase
MEIIKTHLMLKGTFISFVLSGFLSVNSIAEETEGFDPNQSSKYLEAVREFADNVLKYGRDTYGPKHTPLFVDGLMVRDPNNPNNGKDRVYKPVEWIDPNNGDHWILSNLASQQNLFRTLDGLTRITGDPKYKQAAMDAIAYAFDNLRGPNGLFYWGVGYAYDADRDRERSDGLTCNHSLRFVYPYYELMWEVTQDGLKDYVESLWAAHVLDWSNLDVLRYAPLDKYKVAKGWNHEYKGGPVSNVGEGDCVTGSDLYYAAAILSKLSGEKEPLVWAKRMAYLYVETRDPNTGISSWFYNIPTIDKQSQFVDDFEGRRLSLFPPQPMHFAKGEQKVPFWAYAQTRAWICTCLLGDFLDSDGEDFKRWALEELTAWGKSAYRKRDNVFIPMFTDGTSLEGYVVKKDGPYGAKGTIFKTCIPMA